MKSTDPQQAISTHDSMPRFLTASTASRDAANKAREDSKGIIKDADDPFWSTRKGIFEEKFESPAHLQHIKSRLHSPTTAFERQSRTKYALSPSRGDNRALTPREMDDVDLSECNTSASPCPDGIWNSVLSDCPPTGIHSPNTITNTITNPSTNPSINPTINHNPKYAHVASKLFSPTVATICARKDKFDPAAAPPATAGATAAVMSALHEHKAKTSTGTADSDDDNDADAGVLWRDVGDSYSRSHSPCRSPRRSGHCPSPTPCHNALYAHVSSKLHAPTVATVNGRWDKAGSSSDACEGGGSGDGNGDGNGGGNGGGDVRFR